jgi:hypothetical protein
MKTYILFFICFLLISTCSAQKNLPDSLYWRQTPPGDSAIVFAPGIISLSNRRETKIVFSQDGLECLIGIGENNTFKILYSNHYSGHWTDPVPASFITVDRPIEPFFTPYSLHIFFTSYADIYVCTKVNQVWSAPVKLSSPINTNYEEYHPTTTIDGTLYFCSMRENSSGYIYRSRYENGNYTTIEKLSGAINRHDSQQNGAWDPYIAPDESYIIFTTIRPDSYGQEDQYISYNRNGHWTNPKNLGHLINTNVIEYGSYISPDSKYYFFSRPSGWGANVPADIFWVSANFIERLKHTNFIPYLKNQIPNQTDTVGQLFNYTFPDSTFIDDDGNNTLSYSATLSSGGSLPSWLSFNPGTRTFSGTPTELGSFGLKVIAKDTANASATCTFSLSVVNHTSIHPMNENIINEFKLYQNFPNPFNPSTVISYSVSNNSYVSIKLYDILGKQIATLENSFQKRGLYDITLNMNNLNLSSGFYYYTLTANEPNSNKVFKETKAMNYLK